MYIFPLVTPVQHFDLVTPAQHFLEREYQLGMSSAGDVAMTSPDDVMLCHDGVGTSHSRSHMFTQNNQ